MNKQEFLKGLDLAQPEDKITEIVVPEDKVEKVARDKGTADEPESAPESPGNAKELNGVKSKLLTLEQNGEGLKEELSGINNVIAELRGEIKASYYIAHLIPPRAPRSSLYSYYAKGSHLSRRYPGLDYISIPTVRGHHELRAL